MISKPISVVIPVFREAAGWLGDRSSNRLLLTEHDFEPCFSPDDAAALGYVHRRYWFLVSPDSIRPDCRGKGELDDPVTYRPPDD
jgi:hypothetical protein